MTHVPSEVYFLRLQLSDKKSIVSENLYIMGREEGNYKALLNLPKPSITWQVKMLDSCNMLVTLSNLGKTPAPFLRLNLKGGDGEQILPVMYSDNYITLMSGEQKTINISWKREDARGQQPQVEINALNE